MSNISDRIEEKINQVFYLITSKPSLRVNIDTRHKIPKIYRGRGKIKLIVIGQDPTIVNKASRKNITTVLGLDRPGKMQRYIFGLCEKLGVNPINELYATNLFKNFFEEPPDYGGELLKKILDFWFPILKEEISNFPGVPVITLGDSVLEFITEETKKQYVRDHWGYTENWRNGEGKPFTHLQPKENLLGNIVFPFPRQPSVINEFYTERFDDYISYMRNSIKSSFTDFIPPD
jgi:hypothetical protein